MPDLRTPEVNILNTDLEVSLAMTNAKVSWLKTVTAAANRLDREVLRWCLSPANLTKWYYDGRPEGAADVR